MKMEKILDKKRRIICRWKTGDKTLDERFIQRIYVGKDKNKDKDRE